MSPRRPGRWPLSRPSAAAVGVVAVLAALAGGVPATRGGLFLLGLAALTALYVARRLRRA